MFVKRVNYGSGIVTTNLVAVYDDFLVNLDYFEKKKFELVQEFCKMV